MLALTMVISRTNYFWWKLSDKIEDAALQNILIVAYVLIHGYSTIPALSNFRFRCNAIPSICTCIHC